MDPARRRLLAALSFSCVAPLADWMATADEPETGSYQLTFSHSPEDLIGDLLHGERGEWQRQSETPHEEWYSRRIRERFGAWGPRARRYLPFPDLAERPLNWKQERVIASAARFIGYGYQHHHIPDWEPPADWPWKETCVGRNGKGFDCSNFTSFVYNQSFGIHMSSAVDRQAQLASAGFGRDGTHAIRRIDLPTGYRERTETLQTGDLLYIRGRQDGPVTHVVLWVGNIGRSPSGVPLVLDSHGGGVDDDAGQPIACGVHLRPFRERSWYHRCASHAHRLFA
jgi:cell wall-associated NlpC family hydrolase